MIRRGIGIFFLAALMIGAASCSRHKVQNPIANINSKQPDKVLFDRAMDAMKHGKYDVARMTLQTLINTYPDSEYVARAKLAVGDAWYAEGGSAALAQAEIEYKDFITFFPNMPEAAEAQLKVANIHYKQMEKADRDFTHAKRAEEEYKQLILQFPDSKLVPEAQQRLREVQEVLAEREYRIAHFYFVKEAFPAAIARFKSLVEAYPLYSQADEALYLLGNAYEREVELVRASTASEAAKEKLIAEYMKGAQDAYSQILTRYPVMDRSKDAKARLEAMHAPVPTATAEAIAQNKAEEASRSSTGTIGRLMLNFRRGPDVRAAAKVGEPTMVEPKPADASAMVRSATQTMLASAPGGGGGGGGGNSVSVETAGSATPGPNQPPPTSTPGASGSTNQDPSSGAAASGSDSAPLPPHDQVNEAAQPQDSSSAGPNPPADGKGKPAKDSSSKAKKKKGLRKLIPF